MHVSALNLHKCLCGSLTYSQRGVSSLLGDPGRMSVFLLAPQVCRRGEGRDTHLELHSPAALIVDLTSLLESDGGCGSFKTAPKN